MQKHSLVIDFSDQSKKREHMQRIAGLKGLWEIKMKERSFIRSLRSNDYYWAAIVEGLVQCMLAQGEVWDKDDAHEQLKRKCGLKCEKQMTNVVTSEIEVSTLDKSTSKYTVEEMSAYIERCRIFLHDFFGYDVPDQDIFEMT